MRRVIDWLDRRFTCVLACIGIGGWALIGYYDVGGITSARQQTRPTPYDYLPRPTKVCVDYCVGKVTAGSVGSISNKDIVYQCTLTFTDGCYLTQRNNPNAIFRWRDGAYTNRNFTIGTEQ